MNIFPVTNWSNHAGACHGIGSDFYFNSLDEITARPLSGAHFHLCQRNEPIAHSVSNARGVAGFHNISPGWYSLVQSATPSGYHNLRNCWLVLIENNGKTWIDNAPENQFQVKHKAIQDSENASYNVYVVDIDVTEVQLLGHRIEMVAAGYNITLYAKNYPGYELISPVSHIFYNVQKKENWAFQYRKL